MFRIVAQGVYSGGQLKNFEEPCPLAGGTTFKFYILHKLLPSTTARNARLAKQKKVRKRFYLTPQSLPKCTYNLNYAAIHLLFTISPRLLSITEPKLPVLKARELVSLQFFSMTTFRLQLVHTSTVPPGTCYPTNNSCPDIFVTS